MGTTTRQQQEEVLIATDDGGGHTYQPHPAGQFTFVCADVHDEGVRKTPFLNEDGTPQMKRQVRIVFQSEEHGEDGKPLEHSEWYTLSLNEAANLRVKLLEPWRGRPFTAEELKGFDLMKLRGVNGYVQIAHKPKNAGGVKAIIQSIMKLPKGMGTISVSPDFKRIRDRVKPTTNGTPPKATASAPEDIMDDYPPDDEDTGEDLPF